MHPLVDAHLRELRWRNYSPNTIYQRGRVLARLHRHARAPVPELGTEQLRAFLERRQRDGRPLSAPARSAELGHLRSFYKWLVIEGHRTDDPTTQIHRPRLPRWLPHPISERDLALAIDTAPDRVRPLLLLGAYAGLRACEVGPLRGEDILWHEDPPVIWVRRGKGGDDRRVPLHDLLAAEFRDARRGPLNTTVDGEPMPPHLVSHLANRHLHRQGIAETFHGCRHRFGTLIYRLSGGDMRQVQELMGHRSIVSSQVYTAVDQSRAADLVASLPIAA